jgi:DNA-binding NarL/FixJ family response regulator
LIRQIKERDSRIKILVISAFQESLYGERALRAGALGFLNKQETQSKLLEAITCVLQGDRYVSPDLSRRLISQALTNGSQPQEPTQLLSNRELEVFRMIGQGLTSGAIANQLHLSRHTIDTHRENIKRKLGARDAGELNRQAVQWLLENG